MATRIDARRLFHREADAVAVNLCADDAGFNDERVAIASTATSKLRYGVFLLRIPGMRFSAGGQNGGGNKGRNPNHPQ